MAKQRLSREEILGVLREVACDEGAGVTLRGFVERTGIAESQVRKHFGSWTALLKELGRSGAERDYRRHADEQLWEAYHKLVGRLGRFPTQAEIDRDAPFSSRTYYARFGPQPHVKAAYRQWLAQRASGRRNRASGRRQSADGGASAATPDGIGRREPTDVSGDLRPPLAGALAGALTDGETNDMIWLRNQWRRVRIAFELRSSEFCWRSASQWDLLVVLEHDWPACPVQVLRLCDLLPENGEAPPDEEPTRAELYGRMPWEEELLREFP